MALRLNIGAGSTVIDGFIGIDRKNGQEAFPLPFTDNTVEEIRCSHLLEHLNFGDAELALRDWVRVLKVGCRIRLAVPDPRKILELMGDDPRWPYYLMGGQLDENDYHKSAWDELRLRTLMLRCGLTDIQPWEGEHIDCASHTFSLNLEGIKRMPDITTADPMQVAQTQDIKIAAVIGIPRIGWNDHWGCAVDALSPWNIPIRRHIGAFWGHNMQTVLEGCLRDGIDWVLTLDYDTMFTKRHVSRMFELFGSHPEIDALAALQTRRGCQHVLCTNGDTEIWTNGEPFKANTAHFGLTLIRVDGLKDLPKPWMWDQPSASGSWEDDDRVDCDIYFWKQWQKHGKSLYIAPDVRIGHLELMVSQLNEKMEFEQVHVGEWMNARNK